MINFKKGSKQRLFLVKIHPTTGSVQKILEKPRPVLIIFCFGIISIKIQILPVKM